MINNINKDCIVFISCESSTCVKWNRYINCVKSQAWSIEPCLRIYPQRSCEHRVVKCHPFLWMLVKGCLKYSSIFNQLPFMTTQSVSHFYSCYPIIITTVLPSMNNDICPHRRFFLTHLNPFSFLSFLWTPGHSIIATIIQLIMSIVKAMNTWPWDRTSHVNSINLVTGFLLFSPSLNDSPHLLNLCFSIFPPLTTTLSLFFFEPPKKWR